jgi:hypothetical protein
MVCFSFLLTMPTSVDITLRNPPLLQQALFWTCLEGRGRGVIGGEGEAVEGLGGESPQAP